MRDSRDIAIIWGTVVLAAIIFLSATPNGRRIWNNYSSDMNKVDEESYETKKAVEDTARNYIASYYADVDIYHSYCDSEDSKLKAYAESAKIRAISTANSYNEYLRKNSYVWKDNIPSDLPETLDTIIE